MGQTQTDKGMIRREFLGWLCKISGGTAAVTLGGGLLPLRKINTVMLSDARAATCIEDTCATSDSGGVCTTRDVCDSDQSLECTNDECISDKSGDCSSDNCVSDSSGECTNDECISDSSGECTADRCASDSSGACENDGGPACPEDDSCTEDYVGCRDDYSGSCQSDSSKGCKNDSCRSDSSGECGNDICSSDSSGECQTDFCTADSSGAGDGDDCVADSSGECATDFCVSDKSGDCGKDNCTSDSSGDCGKDNCTSDSSGDCAGDNCSSDSSGSCPKDACTADASGECFTSDVCVRDFSNDCTSDLCRDDRNESVCGNDTCGLDLASGRKTSRREFARTGLNQALKMLYKLASVILVVGLLYGGHARAEINATDAAFSPAPDFITEGSLSVPDPVGPFLRDCDNDGILEADVNGDGLCADDPELRDYNSDGNLELPEGTEFSGSFQFTCFYIPYNAVIMATGPLTIAASDEFAVFGTLRLSGGGTFSCQTDIDLRTSAWLAETGSLSFTTATAGPVLTDPESDLTDDVPSVDFISSCTSSPEPPPPPTASIPTLNEWGLMIASLLIVIYGLAFIRRQRVNFG